MEAMNEHRHEGEINEQETADGSDSHIDSDAESEESFADEEDGLDEQTWPRVRANDPNITALFVSWGRNHFAPSVAWEDEGHHIGANTNLKKITIAEVEENLEDDCVNQRKNLIDFCKGLALNKSMEHLELNECKFMSGDVFAFLWPLFHSNRSLRRLEISLCNMNRGSVFMLASSLSKGNESRSSLEQIEFSRNKINGDCVGKIIASLKGHGSLSKLSLTANKARGIHFGTTGGFTLGNLLGHPACRVRDLDLGDSNINDEGLDLLIDALAKNDTVKKLSLADNRRITVTGWSAFSTYLQAPNPALKELNVEGNTINDEGAEALGKALAHNAVLKVLDMSFNKHTTATGWAAFFAHLPNHNSALRNLRLGMNHIDDGGMSALGNYLTNNRNLKNLEIYSNRSIGVAGWRAFSSALGSPNSGLEKLCASANYIEDDGAFALANGLANNTTLKSISLWRNRRISPAGWRDFFDVFQNPSAALEEVDLSHNNVGDEGAAALVGSLGCIRSLKVLTLRHNFAITIQGWQSFSNLLRHPDSMLTQLYLYGNIFNDEVLAAFSSALANNKKLSTLEISVDSEIIRRGWETLSNALCDKSSIGATYSSNHTLNEVFDQSVGGIGLPSELEYLLQLSRDNTTVETARKKIIQYHLLGNGINVEVFVGMETKILPRAFAWIGRDRYGFPVLYRLLQSIPSLFDSKEKMKVTGFKRKRG